MPVRTKFLLRKGLERVSPYQHPGGRRENTLKKITIVLVISLGLISCTTPLRYTDEPLQPYDRDTQYRIDETNNGFVITIYYSRFQFYPEITALALACKSTLTSMAYEYAQKRNRNIKPINEQMIKISTGRNIAAGITSCSASTQVQYGKDGPEKPLTSTPITPSSGTTNIVTVTWTSANIRSGVGNEFPVMTTVKQGDRLTVIGESGEWFNVRLEDGKEGWINSRVVK